MNSINKQQPERNEKNLIGKEAARKIQEIGEKAKTCFFCTDLKSGKPFAARPMSLQKADDNGICWFLSASDSRTNEHIQADPHVQLLFQGSDYSDFLSLYGTATISTDKAKINELWGPIYKTWFTEGKDDSRITVIGVTPQNGYYWDTKHGQFVAFAKQLAGAMTGQTLDDSIEGKLSV